MAGCCIMLQQHDQQAFECGACCDCRGASADVQWEVFAGNTGTDGDVVHFTNGGVPVALISIPLRYMHSSIETASNQDLETIIELISEFLVRFDDSFSFDPFP